MRAFVRNVQNLGYVQGGSTITQQLVKNYFLTHERSLKRKFKEIFMALLLDFRFSKDEILAAYVNEIYMGALPPFQLRGLAAAAEHYFQKGLGDLDLSECSLLAAIINSPGLYNPFRHPERAKKRQSKVLKEMVKYDYITQEEADNASAKPLPKRPKRILTEPAPYFVDAVNRKVNELQIDTSGGARIYTTLDKRHQEAAQKAVSEGVEGIESWYKSLLKIKESGKSLQGLLISADPKRGQVKAIVGGRDFQRSQFNRAVQSRRQVGSIMKPFVFLTALLSKDDTGEPYTPFNLCDDERFETRYDRQVWSPKNFGNEYFGTVPMYFALKSSLNCATASLGIRVGLKKIVETARLLGVTSEIEPLPSLTLGAYELSPMEVLQSYSTIANFGKYRPLQLFTRIEDLKGGTLYFQRGESEQRLSKEATAVLIGMMKQTIENGTAATLRKLGFSAPAAGKTGTTSDSRDAWFGGFTPSHVAISWVGYDDNTSHGLTGASGAVPIWSRYMKTITASSRDEDFAWPEGVAYKEVDIPTQRALGVPDDPERPLTPIRLIFKEKGPFSN
jgi:penicillin-binding protein 1B